MKPNSSCINVVKRKIHDEIIWQNWEVCVKSAIHS